MSLWNGYYECTCYHPLFVFNQFGDLERCSLHPGNVHNTDGWWCAEAHRGTISRQGFAHLFSCASGLRRSGSLRVPRSRWYKVCDPVSGEPSPSREDCIPADADRRTTSDRGAAILREFHLSGRKLDETTPVIAKVELCPRVGFIVTNMARSAENVVAFYNKRGNCEQWIKGRKRRDQMDAAVMSDVRCQRCSTSTSWVRLQSRQFPAHVGDARGRHFPAFVRRHPAADRGTAATARSSGCDTGRPVRRKSARYVC